MIDVIPLGKKQQKVSLNQALVSAFRIFTDAAVSIDTLNTNLNYFCFWRQIIIKELCTLYI